MNESYTAFAYLIAAVLFILALRGLSHPTTSRRGNQMGIAGMAIAIVATFAHGGMSIGGVLIIVLGVAIGGTIGTIAALRIKMTALPQLVAAFHSLVGLAAVFVAASALNAPQSFGIGTPHHIHLESLIEMSLGLAIGAITFTGSLIAFAKLQALMSGTPIMFKGQHPLNLGLGVLIFVLIILFVASGGSFVLFALIALTALLLGLLLIIPIGGSSGAILSYIMCKGMNRSIINVIAGGFGATGEAAVAGPAGDRGVKIGSAADAAFIMKNASKVIVVPGYGMAVSQAQHALREMADVLKKDNVEVKYAIHPVAGRMPGHMNVLLAEANVPYDEVFELEQINNEFSTADVVYVIGANDVTNPAAKTNPASPIFGMPILEVDKAKTVLFVKRSMASGYAGVDNELFFRDNTMMLFGDAKKMTEEIVQDLGH
jgi:NAD(P) transhydrogenase subunit beta